MDANYPPYLIIEIIHIEGGRRKWCFAKVIFVRKVKLQCGFAVRYGNEAETLSENEAINAHRAYTGGETQKAMQGGVQVIRSRDVNTLLRALESSRL